jgi:hypothetical protein
MLQEAIGMFTLGAIITGIGWWAASGLGPEKKPNEKKP